MDAVRAEMTGVRSARARHGSEPGSTGPSGGQRAGCDVTQDRRAPFLTALERARAAAYPAGEYVGQIGTQATADLVTVHQLWTWLGSGRARKFALVAEKQ